MTVWLPYIDWVVVTAIAQILGVVATFLAVVVALHATRPHMSLKALLGQDPQTKKFSFIITAVNISNIPIRISFIGLSFRKKLKTINKSMSPKVLASGESIDEIYDLPTLKKMINQQVEKGYAKKSNKIKIYVSDPSKYYTKTTKYSIKEVLETLEH